MSVKEALANFTVKYEEFRQAVGDDSTAQVELDAATATKSVKAHIRKATDLAATEALDMLVEAAIAEGIDPNEDEGPVAT